MIARPHSPPPDAAREAITAATRAPETELVPGLLEHARLEPAAAARAHALALTLAAGVREQLRSRAGLLGTGGRAGLVQGLLQEFALSSQEGVALMCLAEALLRIPDAATRDALIRDKIGRGDWKAHLGRSPSLFVNAAAWGLVLTGELVATHSEAGLTSALRRLLGRGGEPLIRKGVDLAMRLMGEQFVTGQTIEEALVNAQPREARGFRFSYDMLGEAALTEEDAQRYLGAYAQAIEAIGRASGGRGLVQGPGISIKLSALHPRYSRAQAARVHAELYPRLLQLVQLARRHDIGLNIDAEESERLELSLDLLQRLCLEPELAGWNGIGFVVQAYSKRCPAVIDCLIDLARRSAHRLMVRLVKGAYWDSEIKRAQLDGLPGYPVYTRKPYTDVAYLACARRMLAAPDAIYPQFATHNAHTLAALHELAGAAAAPGTYEFQCLHGMGEPLYEQVVGPASEGGLGRPCRIYAPVGTHETLLAYLVRRLLENGANTSFVNRIADESLPLEALVRDPVEQVAELARHEGAAGLPHPAIPLPGALFERARANSQGLDLASDATLRTLVQAFEDDARADRAQAGLSGVAIRNPADRSDLVGKVREATPSDVEAALQAATAGAPAWAGTPAADRAAVLDRAADAMQAALPQLLPLLAREAGKTWANAVAEVREAVDFLRHDAQQLRTQWDDATHLPLGPVACISPWNFPLAIFTGQVAAALAAGNPVLAKPAEQTPLVAAQAVRLLHEAGVPREALHLLPGPGETVGAALVADARVQGVLFTGSTEVARLLQRTLAQRLDARGRPVTLVAETGGQNAMFVDSSALPEQVVADVLASAFDSAGQRCSALRVLCVQDDVADRLLHMLEGAMRELRVGDPRQLAVDVGPLIDEEARARVAAHVAAMRARGRRVVQPAATDPAAAGAGVFYPPTLIEIEHLSELEREVFGPVLHVLRHRREDLPEVLEQVRATGYGLTQGVHSRIDETVAQVAQASAAGNLYVNRNIVGAVVGVQPFGGEGLSGTGPKAGGPLYLLRLLTHCPQGAAALAVQAAGPEAEPPVRGLYAEPIAAAPSAHGAPAAAAAHTAGSALQTLQTLQAWLDERGPPAAAQACRLHTAAAPGQAWRALPGPTGEANLYAVRPRERVLCLADEDADRLVQLGAILAVGGHAMWPTATRLLWERLPRAVQARVTLVDDWQALGVAFDAALHHGPPAQCLEVLRALARRPGPIVGLTGLRSGEHEVPLSRLLTERSLSVNTAAAGGNASLMTLE
jgi:RHH-type proline utilization regulon transcriptional repressor/proline dehydrogenase/delta 1-pyrroline-5-carboxylate dehydrogenase